MSWWVRAGGSARGWVGGVLVGRAVVVVAVLVVFGVSAGVAGAAATLHFTVSAPRSAPIPPSEFRVLTAAPAYRNAPSRQMLTLEGIAGTTIPTFSSTVVAGQDGKTYGYTIVGANPFSGGTGSTSVPMQVIPVTITDATSHDVYDPTVANASCGETVAPVTAMLTGPLLKNREWYAGSTFVGDDEYIGAQMREEFWSAAKRGGVSPSYHVRLTGSAPATVSVTVSGGSEVSGGTCSELEEISMSGWDSFLQSTIIPQLTSEGAISSTAFPFFLYKNVVFTQAVSPQCCILGWHSAFTNSGGNSQTYGNGDYITDGQFGGTTDMAAISHEAGEWANDPFVTNPTPAWGHIGQVPTCQGNLEVGDPLSGTVFPVNANTTVSGNHPTYHLQELALFGWFFDDNIGVNGWYSTRGKFTSGATLCS